MPGAMHNPDRSVFLTDGVVAIAVTLLALDLKPDLPSGATSGELAHYLHENGRQYFAFLLAFWLIARYWVLHHSTMEPVHHLDDASLWANIAFLFGITCLPLTTYGQGTYSSSLATTLFCANLIFVSVAIGLLRALIHRRGLSDEDDSRRERIQRDWRLVGTITVPVVVIALSWVIGTNADYFFLLFLVSDLPARFAARRVSERS